MGNGITTNFDISLIVLPIMAVALVAVAFFKIRELTKKQDELNSAIVLVPLYKKKFALLLGVGVMFLLALISILGIFKYGYAIQMISLAIGLLSVASIFICMMKCKFAVLSTGVLLPYRFVEWSEIYDYIIEKDTVIFTGDGMGRYTLSSTTVKMKFNAVDLKKLEKVLAKNKRK